MNRDGHERILLPLRWAPLALVLLIACGNTAALLLVRGLQLAAAGSYAVRERPGERTRGAVSAGVGGEPAAGSFGRRVGSRTGLGGRQDLQGDWRLRHPATGFGDHPGWPVLACGLGSAMVAAVLAGLLPAYRASRLDPMQVLKSAGPNSSAGRGERRLLRGVTMIQTALTLALLVGAGLLIRTMMNVAARVQSGYSAERILTMSVTAVQGDWMDFHRRALRGVSALPGVQYAAFAWGVPLTGNSWPGSVDIEGQPTPAKPSDRPSMPVRSVTEDYFQADAAADYNGARFPFQRYSRRAECGHREPGVRGPPLFPMPRRRARKLWPGGQRRNGPWRS